MAGLQNGRGRSTVVNATEFEWRKPTGCETNACVETAEFGDHVYVRDSKEPDGPVLTFTREEWTAHVRGILAEAESNL